MGVLLWNVGVKGGEIVVNEFGGGWDFVGCGDWGGFWKMNADERG